MSASPYLQPVPNGLSFDKLVGFGRYRQWLDQAMAALDSPRLVKPRGVLLVGPPACGKYACARATAMCMSRPMFRLAPEIPGAELPSVLDSLEPCVLWIEELDERHRQVVRWMSSRAKLPVLVIASSTRPWALPTNLLRADGFDRVFYLDLPDLAQRGHLWDAAIARYQGSPTDYDPVRLAQASGLFTPGEIMASARRAFIAAGEGNQPSERQFVEQVAGITPIAIALDEDIARFRHWAKRHALNAHGSDLRV